VDVRALTWNLFHGRDYPPGPELFTWRSRLLKVTERNATHVQVNRSLLHEFADVLAAADWSVCLLQEVPLPWAGPLAERCGAGAHVVRTSRNQLAPLRRRLAHWNPDLMQSWEGGSNLTLARPPWRIAARAEVLLNPLPRRGLRERRWMVLTALTAGRAELCVGNLHATAGNRAQAEADVRRGAERALRFAGMRPLILGGDFNLRPKASRIFDELERSFGLAPPTADDALDHLLVHGLEVVEPPRPWPPERRELPFSEPGSGTLRLRLSDHAPVEAAFALLRPSPCVRVR
jgi:endonuclease/exonuclease/phosphatase family metal-dependent hydrolase